ncbi:MAG: VTT domain-containing protein [Magnetococcus sp. YQC-5]
MLLVYLHQDELDPLQFMARVQELGTKGMVIFVFLYALATILFLPGSVLTLAGGALFGPWLGGILSLTGATLGAGVAFLISRYLAGEWVTQRAGGMMARLLAGVEAEGWRFVAFVRLVPIFPFNVLNYALGLTRIRLDHYLLTSLICMAPGGLAYAWLGYAGKEAASGSIEAIRAGIWALGLLCVAFLLPRWIKRMRHTSMGMVLFCLGSFINSPAAEAADCLSCHRERDAVLVTAWENSSHRRANLECHTCHGEEHNGQMAAHSRRNESCTGCHTRETKSYLVSKHGVIATLEAGKMDFSQLLSEGSMRSPTCAYCHMHRGNHQQPDDKTVVCRDCHSPRFVGTWFATGERMVEIGRMKIREAEEVINGIQNRNAGQAKEAQVIYRQMTEDHFINLRLGVGHQSPDDQWWQGHPALDGDLLRIKSIASDHLLRPDAGPVHAVFPSNRENEHTDSPSPPE